MKLYDCLWNLNTLFVYKILFSWPKTPMYLLAILRIFFILPFTKNLKNIVISQYGLYTNNLTKSFTFHTIKNLHLNSKILTSTKTFKSTYLQPITMVNFSFHKKVYNTFIIYILYFLTHIYVNNFTNFQLWHTYIILPKHFYILNFCNNYYFHLHHM